MVLSKAMVYMVSSSGIKTTRTSAASPGAVIAQPKRRSLRAISLVQIMEMVIDFPGEPQRLRDAEDQERNQRRGEGRDAGRDKDSRAPLALNSLTDFLPCSPPYL